MASILVADDDAAIRSLLRRALAGEGHEVITVPNGREALDRVAIAEPDVLILDLMMPLMSGWEVYTQLTAQRGRSFQIIVMTAGSQISLARQAMADAVVMAKPFDLDQLFSTIDHLLERACSAECHEYRAA